MMKFTTPKDYPFIQLTSKTDDVVGVLFCFVLSMVLTFLLNGFLLHFSFNSLNPILLHLKTPPWYIWGLVGLLPQLYKHCIPIAIISLLISYLF